MCLMVELLPVFSDQRNCEGEVSEACFQRLQTTHLFCLHVPDIDVALGSTDVDEVASRIEPADCRNLPAKRGWDQFPSSGSTQHQDTPGLLRFLFLFPLPFFPIRLRRCLG